MRVLVTGGAGFIGSHIVDALHGAGCDVVVFDAFLPKAHGASAQVPADVVTGDVRDRVAVEEALAGVDLVCHQAAVVGMGRDFADAPEYVSCNDLGTAVLLAAMASAGVTRLLLAGSMVVYGEGRYDCSDHGSVTPAPRCHSDLEAGRFEATCPHCSRTLSPGLVYEDAAVDPRSLYAATKAAQEHLVSSWARAVGGVATSLRYHNVYGPRMPKDTPYAGVASFFRSALSSGTAPQVFEDGRQRRDFVHVRDIADANVVAAQALDDREPGSLRAYNVASGQPHTIGQMADTLAKAYGGPPPVVTGRYRLGDVRHITASIDRIGRELGWSPKIEFAEGMTEFAAAPLRAG